MDSMMRSLVCPIKTRAVVAIRYIPFINHNKKVCW
jgi:hypothetical protein